MTVNGVNEHEVCRDVPGAEVSGCCCAHSASDTATQPYGYVSDKSAYQQRMKRIQGQLNGVAAMIENEEYCIDVLTQIAAISGALKSLSLLIMNDHMRHCLVNAVRNSDSEAEVKLAEVEQILKRFMK